MRELLTIGIGQAGCNIGAKLNETLCDEHGIDPSGTFWGESDIQLEHIDVHFYEGVAGKYVPRFACVDLEPGVLETIRTTRYGQTVRPDNYVFARSGSGNNFARGYYTEGAEILENALECIRREAELAESLQGFQIIHGISGGTGGGFGALMLDNLREEYSDRTCTAWSIFSSTKISDIVIDPYNSVLCGSHLLEACDFSCCVDNEALSNIHRRTLQMLYPMYSDLNHMISVGQTPNQILFSQPSMCMAGVTAAFRFPGQLNCDLRKLSVSLVPFPALHFFIPGFVPQVSRGAQNYKPLNVPELVREMFNVRSIFSSCDPAEGKFITAGAMFRGMVSTRTCEECLYQFQKKHSKKFSEYLPSNVKTSYCDIPPRGLKMCASFLGNTTIVNCLWGRILDNFAEMLRRKAYLHWFTGEGMEESELIGAQTNMEDLIQEYQIQAGGFLPDFPAQQQEEEEEEATDA